MEKSIKNKTVNRIFDWYINKGAYYLKYLILLPNTGCRFYPTCSEYSKSAVSKYGLIIGAAKSVWRIIRCNPYSKGGIDYP